MRQDEGSSENISESHCRAQFGPSLSQPCPPPMLPTVTQVPDSLPYAQMPTNPFSSVDETMAWGCKLLHGKLSALVQLLGVVLATLNYPIRHRQRLCDRCCTYGLCPQVESEEEAAE